MAVRLMPEIWDNIINFLPDEDKINWVLYNSEIPVKPHLSEIYTVEELEDLENKFVSEWDLDEPIPITDLFFLAGVIPDANNQIPKKYKGLKIFPPYIDFFGKKRNSN